ncbi:MAG TPA: YdeI/OmpD-associated family protein [Flavipsychrobacter sp.]|nr:YdeI/OmpD-associated family protein [Flavipsychrobacter sp.]
MPKTDERIDLYIAKSADFAQPILSHLRKLVHVACPACEETIKWGFPHFDYNGAILCSMASFKQHCSFGFFKATLMEDPHGVLNTIGKTSMGSFGKVTSRDDLPSDKIIKEYIKEAMKLNDAGIKMPVAPKKAQAKKSGKTPPYLATALKGNKKAAAAFEAFSPSARNEYIEWLEEAKTEATRDKRLATAMEWISEGKSRHWKYKK